MTSTYSIEDDAQTRLAAIIEGMQRVFGDDAAAVAQRQYDAAEGEAQAVWQRILIALSHR